MREMKSVAEIVGGKIGLSEGQFRKMTKSGLVEFMLQQQEAEQHGTIESALQAASAETLFTALCDKLTNAEGEVPHCLFFDRNSESGSQYHHMLLRRHNDTVRIVTTKPFKVYC